MNLKTLLRDGIAFQFWNYSDTIEQESLETPSDLIQKTLTYAQIVKRTGRIRDYEQNPSYRLNGGGTQEDGSLFSRAKRICKVILERLSTPANSAGPAFERHYLIEDFPVFSAHFPQNGIAVGTGNGLHWIRPVRIQFKISGPDGISAGDELTCTFALRFRDGLGGHVGYMDRIKSEGEFSRWHIYPGGDIISADLYRDHRITHDLFRTLMGNILRGEIDPCCYREPSL